MSDGSHGSNLSVTLSHVRDVNSQVRSMVGTRPDPSKFVRPGLRPYTDRSHNCGLNPDRIVDGAQTRNYYVLGSLGSVVGGGSFLWPNN